MSFVFTKLILIQMSITCPFLSSPTSIPSGRTSHPSEASVSAPLPNSWLGEKTYPHHGKFSHSFQPLPGVLLLCVSAPSSAWAQGVMSKQQFADKHLAVGCAANLSVKTCRQTHKNHICPKRRCTGWSWLPFPEAGESYFWEPKTWNCVSGSHFSTPIKYPGSQGLAL